MRTIIATDRQNIIDLATQYYGSAAGAIDLCKDNGWELDHDVQPGDQVLLQDTYPESADADVADYLQGTGVVVVSISEINYPLMDGDFIITNDGYFISDNSNNFITI